MPYRWPDRLPLGLNGCPNPMIRLFIRVWNKVYRYSEDEEKAFRIAWNVCKKRYKKVGDKWVVKNNTEVLQWNFEKLFEKLGM